MMWSICRKYAPLAMLSGSLISGEVSALDVQVQSVISESSIDSNIIGAPLGAEIKKFEDINCFKESTCDGHLIGQVTSGNYTYRDYAAGYETPAMYSLTLGDQSDRKIIGDTDFPIPRIEPMTLVFEGKLFLVGGYSEWLSGGEIYKSASSTTYILDDSGTWHFPASGSHGGKNWLYVLNDRLRSAGYSYNSYRRECRLYTYEFSDVEGWVYDDNPNQPAGLMPISLCQSRQVAVLDDVVYAVTPSSDSSTTEIWNSVDGKTWSKTGELPFPSVNNTNALIEHKGQLFYLDADSSNAGFGNVWYLTSTGDWQVAGKLPLPSDCQSLSLGTIEQSLVASCPTGAGYQNFWSSENGSDWFGLPLMTAIEAREGAAIIKFNNEVLLLGGKVVDSSPARPIHDYIMSTKDLRKWTSEIDGRVQKSSSVHVQFFNEKFYRYAGGSGARASVGTWTSLDGISWRFEGYNSIYDYLDQLTIVEYDQKLLAFGRNYASGENLSYVSNDGISWSFLSGDVPFYNTSNSVVVHGNYIYATAGTLQLKIWRSKDGINWDLIREDSNLLTHTGYQLVSYNGILWRIGGKGAMGQDWNRIYYSVTGKYWYLSTADVAFPARSRGKFFEWNDRLYLAGGSGQEYDDYSDLWTSDNGRDWTLVTEDMGFRPVAIANSKDTFVAIKNDYSMSGKNLLRVSENLTDWGGAVVSNFSLDVESYVVSIKSGLDSDVIGEHQLSDNASLDIDLSVYSEYEILSVESDCGGYLDGDYYIIDSVSKDCQILVDYDTPWWAF